MSTNTLAPILACRIRNIPNSTLTEARLEELAKQVENKDYDAALHAVWEHMVIHQKLSNTVSADHARNLHDDLLAARTRDFDPDVDEFEIEQIKDTFQISLVVMDGNDVDELKRQGYSINQDEEATFAERHVPGKWEICERCGGHGKHDHPAFSNGITESDREEMGEDSFHGYIRGDYDVKCSPCKGSGKVFVVNQNALRPWERKELERQAADEAAFRAEQESERRMGA